MIAYIAYSKLRHFKRRSTFEFPYHPLFGSEYRLTDTQIHLLLITYMVGSISVHCDEINNRYRVFFSNDFLHFYGL